MELIVLGCSGSYPAPQSSSCSGYLIRSGDTKIWMDCGNGTFGHLQEHVRIDDLDAVVITHEHPDHCVDLYGLHVMVRYGLDRTGVPVFAPEGLAEDLGTLVDNSWGGAFDWHAIDDDARVEIGDVSLGFSRTDHPPPTYAVELSSRGKRLVYTADTGPGWAVDAFAPGADLVLSEATYLHASKPADIHLSAREAGTAAREARARRLMITHLWPLVAPERAVLEASEAYGESVTLAATHLVTAV